MSFYNGYNSHESQTSSSRSSPSPTSRRIHVRGRPPNSVRRSSFYSETQDALTPRRRSVGYNPHISSSDASSYRLSRTDESRPVTPYSTYSTSLKFPPHDAKESFAGDSFETFSHDSKPYFSSRTSLGPANTHSRHSSPSHSHTHLHSSNVEEILLNDHSHHSHTHVDSYMRDAHGRVVLATPCLSPQASEAFDTLIAALKERGRGDIVSASALLLRDFLSFDKYVSTIRMTFSALFLI